MENETLATELIRELKAQSKRWFIAFIIAIALWFSTIGVFIWYISLPAEEEDYVDILNRDGNANYIGNDMIGDFNYGQDTSSETETQSSSQTETMTFGQ